MRSNIMITRLIACLGASALLALGATAGALDTPVWPVADTVVESLVPASANGVLDAKRETLTPDRELADTSWRLVKIMSMDDSGYVPDDALKYTLAFGADGTAEILADCNRGTGTWTSTSAGQLQFGPTAATKALCPPNSLSERYLAQFQWVRSYVIKDGHLFLATMADGSIIEFEPIERPLAAIVLGEEVRTSTAAASSTSNSAPSRSMPIASTSKSGRPPVTSRSTRRPSKTPSGGISPTSRRTRSTSEAARRRPRRSRHRRGRARPPPSETPRQ